VDIWDIERGKCIERIQGNVPGSIDNLSFSKEGFYLAAVTTLEDLDADSEEEELVDSDPESSSGQTILIWNTRSLSSSEQSTTTRVLRRSSENILRLKFSPKNETTFFTCGRADFR
jgi:WD40 repeat protein